MTAAVCVDLDGVVLDYHGFQGDDHFGPFIDGALIALNRLRASSYRMVLFTAREIEPVRRFVARTQLRDLVHEVTNVKPKDAVVFFDDRAVHVFANTPHDLRRAVSTWLDDQVNRWHSRDS